MEPIPTNQSNISGSTRKTDTIRNLLHGFFEEVPKPLPIRSEIRSRLNSLRISIAKMIWAGLVSAIREAIYVLKPEYVIAIDSPALAPLGNFECN